MVFLSSWRRQDFDQDVALLASNNAASRSSDDTIFVLDEKELQSKSKARTGYLQSIHKAFVQLCNLVLAFFPSFITSMWRKDQSSDRKMRPTAYLDGLRGVAAWSVFNAHLSAVLTKSSGGAWGHSSGMHQEIYKFPGLRLMYHGEFAVAVFFVISGYVLSMAPISAMSRSPLQADSALRKFASAAFRRTLRLFLPAWGSMFLVFILLRLNYFSSITANLDRFNVLVPGWHPITESWPERMPTVFAQLRTFLSDVFDLFVIFVPPTDPSFKLKYNAVLWTIKLEFRCSLVLYLTQLALFFCTKRARTVIMGILIVTGLCVWSWDLPCFWTGYLFAEYARTPSSTMLPMLARADNGPKSRKFRASPVLYWLLLIVGAYLGSFPTWQDDQTPLYAWLIPYTPFGFVPRSRAWTALGAAMVVFAISRLPVLIALYSSPVIQYLGKISFALYLVHFWLVHGLGTIIFYHVWNVFSKDVLVLKLIGFCIGYGLTLGVVVWVADIFWRFVDVPSVKLTSKVEQWFFVKQ